MDCTASPPRVYMCLGVTWHLHFGRMTGVFLSSTLVTWRWNWQQIRLSMKSQLWRRKFSRRPSQESNPWPFNHESGALPTELSQPIIWNKLNICGWGCDEDEGRRDSASWSNSLFMKPKFNSVPWPIGLLGGHERRFSRDPLPVSGMGKNVHSLKLSIQHFLCWPQRCPPSKVPWRMVLERLLQRATCPNHATFHFLTVARRGSCGLTMKLVLFRMQGMKSKLNYKGKEAKKESSEWEGKDLKIRTVVQQKQRTDTYGRQRGKKSYPTTVYTDCISLAQ